MYYDTEMSNQWYEDRQRELARTYADGQADTAMLRAFVARAVSGLGTMLIRMGQVLDSDAMRQHKQRLQPLRVRTQNGK